MGRTGEWGAREAGEGDRIAHARRRLYDLGGLARHRVGAAERGALRKLDDDDGVALVHRRDEAARGHLAHTDGGFEQGGEEEHTEERRVGKGGVRTGRSRRSPCHYNKKKQNTAIP